MKIHKILIANRAEIALRIIETCQKMSIATVAVYTDSDADLPYVRAADESVRIIGNALSETYLDGEKIIGIALDKGVDAIHPGYGFLSENAEFAASVREHGLIFIGPSPDSIRAMGHKIRAKQLAFRAKVPLIPGSPSAVQSMTHAVNIADKIGYPVLLKAAAGGGGKGMRQVNSRKEMQELYDTVRSEALNFFGDEEVFIEKYLVNPKHIEIQLFGDQHGNYVHLFERDCSIQRRHQKIIEEAPCMILSPQTRERMGEAAIALAREVNYYNSGTVEFLMDKDQNFYFLEMNTRLQVEHPVTEMITGTDLVEWQIRIAEGHPLPLRQEEIKINGHAIQLRLYAEDYLDDFSPSPGYIDRIDLPAHPNIRLDLGFGAGNEVTLYYDPMIGKIICHSATRNECINIFLQWLKTTRVTGIHTTIPFGLVAMDMHAFRSGDYPITFYRDLDREVLATMEKELGLSAARFAKWLWNKNKEEKFLLS